MSKVDVSDPRPYVRRVNLLLLLSALLSALTGAQVGARALPPTVAVSQPAEDAVTARVARASVTGRPIVALPTRPGGAEPIAFVAWRLAAAAPLFASRRRE